MSTPRHPAHRSDPCAFCGRHRQGDDLVHISRLWPHRKRGWVCAEHVVDRFTVQRAVQLALAREALRRTVSFQQVSIHFHAFDKERPEARHGTRAGAIRHRKRGEPVCEPCREADREYQAKRRGSRFFPDCSNAVDIIAEILTG